jgi:hypothetical protein
MNRNGFATSSFGLNQSVAVSSRSGTGQSVGVAMTAADLLCSQLRTPDSPRFCKAEPRSSTSAGLGSGRLGSELPRHTADREISQPCAERAPLTVTVQTPNIALDFVGTGSELRLVANEGENGCKQEIRPNPQRPSLFTSAPSDTSSSGREENGPPRP